MEDNKSRYTHSEEIANSVSHIFGALMALAVCTVFIVKVIPSGSALAVVSMSLYFFGVVSSYVASSVYHACPANKENSKYLLRKFDHAAIYWHIAGGVECD